MKKEEAKSSVFKRKKATGKRSLKGGLNTDKSISKKGVSSLKSEQYARKEEKRMAPDHSFQLILSSSKLSKPSKLKKQIKKSLQERQNSNNGKAEREKQGMANAPFREAMNKREHNYERSVNWLRIVLGVFLHVVVIAFFVVFFYFIFWGLIVPESDKITKRIPLLDFMKAALPYMTGLAVVLVARPAALLRTLIERSSDSPG